VNARTDKGSTPLHHAATEGHPDVAEVLIRHGADVNARISGPGWAGFTPLHWAAYNGQKEVVQLLLSNRADVGAQDNDGFTALNYAENQQRLYPADARRREVVSLLLDAVGGGRQ